MKLSKLFMLCGVLLMVGTSAKAELVNGVRQRPNVAKTETFQVDAETKAAGFKVVRDDEANGLRFRRKGGIRIIVK